MKELGAVFVVALVIYEGEGHCGEEEKGKVVIRGPGGTAVVVIKNIEQGAL